MEDKEQGAIRLDLLYAVTARSKEAVRKAEEEEEQQKAGEEAARKVMEEAQHREEVTGHISMTLMTHAIKNTISDRCDTIQMWK